MNMSGEAFLNRIGLCVHLSQGNYLADLPAVRARLAGIPQIRHLRDSYNLNAPQETWDTITDLSRTLGAKFLMSTWPTMTASDLTRLLSLVAGSVEAIEAPNEYDISGNDPNWIATVQSFMPRLTAWSTTLDTPLPVIGPSIVGYGHAQQLGAVPCDISNVHQYAPGFHPETWGWGSANGHGHGYGSLAYNIDNANATAPGKPYWITEIGYGDASNVHGCLPADLKADYLIRAINFAILSGAGRVYIDELVSFIDATQPTDSTLGICDTNFQPKLAYDRLQWFLSLFPASEHDAGEHEAPVAVQLNGDPLGNFLHYTVRLSTGEWLVVFWNRLPNWDPNANNGAGARIAVPAQNINIQTDPFARAEWFWAGGSESFPAGTMIAGTIQAQGTMVARFTP